MIVQTFKISKTTNKLISKIFIEKNMRDFSQFLVNLNHTDTNTDTDARSNSPERGWSTESHTSHNSHALTHEQKHGHLELRNPARTPQHTLRLMTEVRN